ncbi:hypothetical protein C1H46_035204 [Malus baccata]|uniref:Uncharacterized protein n=1 Tax=Malus baccata TaxID=106549 RepID=A0A540KYE4_MALBA|nr:hypothetical protein C1H46_035204 [Malus baccata]
MGTLPPTSVAVDNDRVDDAKVGRKEADHDHEQNQLDAGARFVLKSRATHINYFVNSSYHIIRYRILWLYEFHIRKRNYCLMI